MHPISPILVRQAGCTLRILPARISCLARWETAHKELVAAELLLGLAVGRGSVDLALEE